MIRTRVRSAGSPRRSRSSRARVSGSSRSRSRDGAPRVRGSLEVEQERRGAELAHLLARRAPHGGVRGDQADELLSRCSAASRSSSASACGAKRTASGPIVRSRRPPSNTTTPRRPLARRSSPAVRQLARRREVARVQEVVAVEEVERRVSHGAAAAAPRRGAAPAATLTFSDSTLPGERDRDRAVAGTADERAHALALGAEDQRDAAVEVGRQRDCPPSAAAAYTQRSGPSPRSASARGSARRRSAGARPPRPRRGRPPA